MIYRFTARNHPDLPMEPNEVSLSLTLPLKDEAQLRIDMGRQDLVKLGAALLALMNEDESLAAEINQVHADVGE